MSVVFAVKSDTRIGTETGLGREAQAINFPCGMATSDSGYTRIRRERDALRVALAAALRQLEALKTDKKAA